MKNVLIISFHFPPDAAVGAVRAAELAKYFPEYGWMPTVLTINEKYYSSLDITKYELNNVDTYRTNKFGNLNSVIIFIKKGINKFKKNSSTKTVRKEWFTPNNENNQIETIKEKLVRYFNSILVYIPDKEVGWLPFAIIKGYRLIKKKNIDAILTTSPPHSVQLIGLVLSKISGKPWIADFRDPWAVQLKPKRSRSLLSDKIENMMEGLVIKNSKKTVSVTKEMTDRLKEKYPLYELKYETLNNGYDSQCLMKIADQSQLYEKFTITYVGSLYFGRDPFIFLQAISELLREKEIESTNFEVRFVGDCRYSDGKSVEEMVAKNELSNIVKFIDQVPHNEALNEVARSHVLLLMAPKQPLQIPGKIYEYIGMRKTILAICDEGATKTLLNDYPFAYVVTTDKLIEMKEKIRNLVINYQFSHEFVDTKFDYVKYERKTIAKEFANLLNKIADVKQR